MSPSHCARTAFAVTTLAPDEDVAADILDPIWKASRLIEAAPSDPKYFRLVRDPDDVIVLRTATRIYFHDDLASCPRQYIVSGDTHSFPLIRNWYGFRVHDRAGVLEHVLDE